MKNTYLLILLVATTAVQAQKSELGVKAGASISTLTYKGELFNNFVPDGKLKLSYALGVFLDVSLSDNFSLIPEVLLASKGSRAEYKTSFGGFASANPQTAVNITRLTYLEFPIYAAFKKPSENGTLFYKIGPYFGILLNGTIVGEMKASGGKEKLELEFGDGQNSEGNLISQFDSGMNFGIGYELNSGVSFNGTYSIGFKNIGNPGPFDPDPNDDQTISETYIKSMNRVFRLSIGVKL